MLLFWCLTDTYRKKNKLMLDQDELVIWSQPLLSTCKVSFNKKTNSACSSTVCQCLNSSVVKAATQYLVWVFIVAHCWSLTIMSSHSWHLSYANCMRFEQTWKQMCGPSWTLFFSPPQAWLLGDRPPNHGFLRALAVLLVLLFPSASPYLPHHCMYPRHCRHHCRPVGPILYTSSQTYKSRCAPVREYMQF